MEILKEESKLMCAAQSNKRSSYGPVRAIVEEVQQISPHFARIVFSGPEMVKVGGSDPVFDQRIKIIFPLPGEPLAQLPENELWYQAWLDLLPEKRGAMRTYSIRDLEMTAQYTRMTVDFVLHLEPGLTGPAARWAAEATPGDEVLIVAPLRDSEATGGIEFDHGQATRIVLAGDETAAPAIARILEDLQHVQPEIKGQAFIEIPSDADILNITPPSGVEIHWLPRAGAPHGELLTKTVLNHLGLAHIDAPSPPDSTAELLWEIPAPSVTELTQDYYWIAGESGVVTRLRRALVKDHGLDRSQVAFMGYWKLGVAMRG